MRLAASETSARAAWRASSLAMRPHDPTRSSETWIIPAARRARQVSGRAAEALDARLSAGGRTLSDPFADDAREGDGADARGTDEETLVDMLLSGRLEAAPPAPRRNPPFPDPAPSASETRPAATSREASSHRQPPRRGTNRGPRPASPARVSTTSRTKNSSPGPSPREGHAPDDATSSARFNARSPTTTATTST